MIPIRALPYGARSSGLSRFSLRPRDTQSKSAKQDRNRGFRPNPHRPILTRTSLAVQVTVVQGRVTNGAFPSVQLS